MTQNQIRYAEHKEKVRSNMASESIRTAELGETTRSNIAKEAETHRTNKANEGIKQQSLLLDTRAQEEIERANKEKERENLRSHIADEAIKRQQLREQVRTNKKNEHFSDIRAIADSELAWAKKTTEDRLRLAKEVETWTKAIGEGAGAANDIVNAILAGGIG